MLRFPEAQLLIGYQNQGISFCAPDHTQSKKGFLKGASVAGTSCGNWGTRKAKAPLLMEAKMRGIEITDNKNGYLTVSLKDILNALANYAKSFSWTIFYLEAVGDLGPNRNMLSLESEIRNSPNGLKIQWDELLELASLMSEVTNTRIEGKSVTNGTPAADSAGLTEPLTRLKILMIDSSVWIVCSTDDEILATIEKRFMETKHTEDCVYDYD